MVQLLFRVLGDHRFTMLSKYVQQPNILQEVGNRGQHADRQYGI